MEINGTPTAMPQILGQTLSPATSRQKSLNAGQRRALATYRDRATLLQRYSPGVVPEQDEYAAIMGNSPTLAVMNSTFGEGTAEVIIASRLCSLNQYTNAKVKITPQQADAMATSLVADTSLKGLKGDVLALFFERLKTGAYGELYNIVDAVSICAKLRQFHKECEAKRRVWAEREERERFEKEMEEHRKRAITFAQFQKSDEYKRLMRIDEKNDDYK